MNIQKFIEELKVLEFYTPIRQLGYTTSGQTSEVCEVVENKIDELIAKHFDAKAQHK